MIQDTMITRRTIINSQPQGGSEAGTGSVSVADPDTAWPKMGILDTPWRTPPTIHRGCSPAVTTPPVQSSPEPSSAANLTEGAIEKISALVERVVGEFKTIMEKAFEAITKLTEKVAELISATSAASPHAAASPKEAATSNLGKTGEFLWKPTSEKDGKLAVLLPSRMTGKVKSVKILDPKGEKTLATGKYSGVGNGDREHFRFTKTGSQFPKGAIVEMTLSDGEKHRITIENTAQRTTR
jgi:hypothetical protein